MRNSHHCPSCGQQLELEITAQYLLVVWFWAAAVTALPATLVFLVTHSYIKALTIFTAGAVLFAVPGDYLLQSYWLRSRRRSC